jgi:hypothetical protein
VDEQGRPPMISAEHATAQVASCTGFIVRMAMFRL